MAIKNINTIQSQTLADITKYEELQELYLKSILNLSQRESVSAGVTTGTFRLADLINDDTIKSNINNYVAVLVSENGLLYIKSYHKDDDKFTNPTNIFQIPAECVTGYILISELLYLDEAIPGIKCYSNDSIIKSDIDSYTVLLRGYNDSMDIVEIVLDRFNKTSNELISGIRIVKKGGVCKIYYLHYCQDEFGEGYSAEEYSSTQSISKLSDLIHDTYVSTGVINTTTITNFTPESIFSILGITRTGSSKQVEYDKNEVQKFKYVDGSPIDDIYAFSYDVAIISSYIKRYYTNVVYKQDNNYLKYHILLGLYDLIIANSSLSIDKVYIPLTYDFNYECNSIDTWQIYKATNFIPVNYISESINGSDFVVRYVNNIVCQSNINHVSLFNYSVTYDNNLSNTDHNSNKIIYGINVEKVYTLPYIDNNDYWVVNEIPTKICSRGKDAGNPNILITYNNNPNSSDIKILSNKSLIDANKFKGWVSRKVILPPIASSNLGVSQEVQTEIDNIEVTCWVPDLLNYINEEDTNEMYQYLKYCTLINISTVNCCSNVVQAKDIFGANGNITTIWTPQKRDDGQLEFVCLTQTNDNEIDYAIDINYLGSIGELIKWQIKNTTYKRPDNYLHNQLVLKGGNVELKNNSSALSQISENDELLKTYPVLINRPGDNKNGMNLSIEFKSNIPNVDTDLIDDLGDCKTNFFDLAISSENEEYKMTSIYTDPIYKEYLYDTSIPTVDFSNVLQTNNNLVNRLNIIAIDEDSKVYNSYIGTRFDEDDKEILTIGTSARNINFNTNTMVSDNTTDHFNIVTRAQLNFESIDINGETHVRNKIHADSSVFIGGPTWNATYIKSDYNNTVIGCQDGNIITTYWNTHWTPYGTFNGSIDILPGGTMTSIPDKNSDPMAIWINSFIRAKYEFTDVTDENGIVTNVIQSELKNSRSARYHDCLRLINLIYSLNLPIDDSYGIGSVIFNGKKIQPLDNGEYILITSKQTSLDEQSGYVKGNPLDITFYVTNTDKVLYHFIINELVTTPTIKCIYARQ